MLFNMDFRDPAVIFINLASLLILLTLAFPIHEFAHGLAAYMLGDKTAKRDGRLTLNPLAHLDLLGTISMVVFGFGWAKPVPVNPFYFKNKKLGMALTSLAGPLSNILMALLCMIIMKILNGYFYVPSSEITFMGVVYLFLGTLIYYNLLLAVFNLLPIPPLDGSKIFGALMPEEWYFKMMEYENTIRFVLIALIITGVLTGPIFWLREILYAGLDTITRFIDVAFQLA